MGRCKPHGGTRPPFQLCNSMKDTENFESKHFDEFHHITKLSDLNLKMFVYLIDYPVFGEQHAGSTVNKFCIATNNCESTHHNFLIRKRLPNQARSQKCFHEHYLWNVHKKIDNYEITIIDQAETVKAFRQKELCCYPKLKT